MNGNCQRFLGLLILFLLQGCAIGYDTILFATKSNIGVDFDSAPPNMEVAISRQEGVFGPVFEDGQTIPVMASFSSDSMSLTKFFWGVNSTFTMGEAAFHMTDLYDSHCATPKNNYQKVKLSNKPKAFNLFNKEKTEYIDITELKNKQSKVKESETVSVRPLLFGTDTSLGIKVKWSGATAQYPSAVSIGFKRKEIAVAPIAISKITKTQEDKEYEADAPSLLATIDADFRVEGGAELTYLQYFATGLAATNLSYQPAVRAAMLRRLDPKQEIQADNALKGKQLQDTNESLIDSINDLYSKSDKGWKKAIIIKAQDLGLVNDSIDNDTKFSEALEIHVKSTAQITAKLSALDKFAAK